MQFRKISFSPCKKHSSHYHHTSCSPVIYKLLIIIPLKPKGPKQSKLCYVSIEQFFQQICTQLKLHFKKIHCKKFINHEPTNREVKFLKNLLT